MMDVDRRREWLGRLERWTDRPLTALALLLVPLLLIPFVIDLSPEVESALLIADYMIWAVFAADLVVKLLVAPDRTRYLRRHWIDVLLVVLPMLRPLRAMRILRLLWVVGSATRVLEGSRRFFARRGTGFLLLGAVVVVLVAAGLVVAVERDDPNTSIQSFGDGLWWAITTVTTVGYGDKYPLTAAGRGIAVALMLVGIAAFGLITANLAALFVEEQDDEVETRLREVNDRLIRVEAALERALHEQDAAQNKGIASSLESSDH
jgi:voltage-gated potassium channel